MSEQTVDSTETNETEQAESNQSTDIRSEFEELKQTNQALLNKLGELTSALNQKKPEATPDLAEIFKTDPVRAIDILAEKKVNEKAGILTKEQQRVTFDSRAENEFPQLKSDLEFQRLVKANIQEMVHSGEMAADAPKLVYRAAQIAALKYKPKAPAKVTQGSEMSGEAPNTSTPKKSASTDKQFDVMAKMFGIKDVNRMKERWDAHKGGKK